MRWGIKTFIRSAASIAPENRLVRGLALCLVLTPAAAYSQALAPDETLSEKAAIEFALARPVLQEAEEARLSIANSAVTETETLPNPVVSMTHERVDVADGSANESTLTVSQTFEISGRRGLRKEAAKNRVQAVQHEVESRRILLAQEVRKAYAEALYRQYLLDSNSAWIKRVESAAMIVKQLAMAGEASGYDRRRLDREVQSAKASMSTVLADSLRTKEILSSLIGKPVSDSVVLSGDLLPLMPPPLETLLATFEKHPELASLDAQAAAFEQERQAAERLRTPDITVGVGGKHVSEPGFSDNGLMLSLSVPIPMFDKGQVQAQQARANFQSIQAERSLRVARTQGELRGLWMQTTKLIQTVKDYQEATLASSNDLSRIAESSYRGGEGSLLELLDAYRAELDAQTMQLEMALRARLARIELDGLTGLNHEN